jgi:hypothetical protein
MMRNLRRGQKLAYAYLDHTPKKTETKKNIPAGKSKGGELKKSVPHEAFGLGQCVHGYV